MKLVKKAVFALLLFFFFSSLTKNLLDYGKKVAFYEDFKKNYEKEKKRNIEFKTQLLKKSDPNEIEKTIRNKLNLLKPDEVAIILKQPSPTPAIITPTPLPNYLQWWEVFF
ncbi:septum formation initiator family protein [Candidatus Roizmanbacteria bacterium]|nr:septum formation initiator family protein [Candidatus Roizmanbacteria bacterium]